jgi:tRNA1(Val) A37 N6-methylase TrmN6
MPHDESAVTDDAVLGGRLRLLQPRRGHRVGHDAILLAAATGARPGELAVDLGAGVGAAGLALAWRVAGLNVALVDNDPALCELAAENIRRNGFSGRVEAVIADVAALPCGSIAAANADRVLMNPPFNDPARQQSSPDFARRRAHVAGDDTLAVWIAAAARLLKPSGVLTMIWRADGVDDVRQRLATYFNATRILPVLPKPDAPPIRILVRASREKVARDVMLAPLVLNDADGKPDAAAEAVLRHAQVLPLASDE